MRHAGLALCACLACGLPSSSSSPFGDGGGGSSGDSTLDTASTTSSSAAAASSSTGSSSTGETSSTSSSSASSSGTVPDFGDVAPLGCQGKIDIIFAISTGTFMGPFQERLLEAFPHFADTLEDELGAFDLHILVTYGETKFVMDDCAICQDPADCDPNGIPDLCGATLNECDQTRGAGTTFPCALGSSGRRCDLAGGRRYIVSSEEPNLADAFLCLARVGYDHGLMPAFDSILPAVGQSVWEEDVELNGPGACNEGFLRDDALLLFVIIQDNYEDQSAGNPYIWRKHLYAAKGGDEDAVIGLAITTDLDTWPQLCGGDVQGLPNRMRTFMEEYLKHGYIRSICEPEYGAIFEEVAAAIGPLCEAFIPQ